MTLRIFEDEFLRRGFFRSLQWEKAKEAEAFKHKRGLRDAIRDYLHVECGKPESQDEVTEIEKAVGRVQLAIHARWKQKAKDTRAKKKRLKERELIRRAKTAIKKFDALKRPMFFPAMPIQHRPINPNRARR